MTGINFFTMFGVAFFLHILGWLIETFYPGGAPSPDVYRIAFASFGGCLMITAMLYGLTGDAKKCA